MHGAAGAEEARAPPQGSLRRLRGELLVRDARLHQVEAAVAAGSSGARMHRRHARGAGAVMHAPDHEALAAGAAVLHAQLLPRVLPVLVSGARPPCRHPLRLLAAVGGAAARWRAVPKYTTR